MWLYVLLKHICFLFNRIIFSCLILVLLFCHVHLLFAQYLVHHMLVLLLFSHIVVRNCKNIRNHFIRCNSVRSSSSNVDRVSKPEYLFVSSSNSVTNISKSLKLTPTYSHSIDCNTFSFRVVIHRNVQHKRKLRKNVTSLSFVNSAKNHDITNKLIEGRDKINVLIKPRNYYIPSVFSLSALF